MTDVQPSLFETVSVCARGPIQSQMTVDSLGKDTSLKYNIARAVAVCSYRPTATHTGVYDRPVTDDMITEYLEVAHNRRYQRNVVARTRGLMEQAGWFVPHPDVTGRTGRPTHAVTPSISTLAALGLSQYES